MTTSTAKVQEIYKEQGYLSALPVLSETELREARRAFSELEKEFGKHHWKIQGPEEVRKNGVKKLIKITTNMS